ncbi:MAG TPA: nucleotidyltransferase [Candidatus Onthousia faecavium]|nr:nucleotidyltransferase [Candidatus Onthousia faecavium]
MSSKVIGIIAEYNPFHNGHLYHLNKVKEMFPNSPIILVLGGNFTQRGDISILDKWTKTDLALKAGIDLIVELPFPFSCASADIFAEGAVGILNYLGVTDLVFGSESDDIEGIKQLVETELYNPDFNSLVKVYLRMGYNYPTALSKALEDITGANYNLPNDILGISYVKAIYSNNYKITPHTIKRTTDYHSKELKEISSATSIREALLNKELINIKESVPLFTYKKLEQEYLPKLDDYFLLLKYKIISIDDLTKYNLVDSGLATKLKKEILDSYSFDELITKVKSKNLTYSRLSRTLIYILCDYTKALANEFKTIKYVRLLGFSTKGKDYLNKVKKDIDIPIISKFTREKDNMLEYEYQITKIYALVFGKEKSKELIENEFKMKPIREE